MSDAMMFPDDWHDFLKDYQFTDDKQVYTNGSRLIAVFRVEQLIDHLMIEKVGHWKGWTATHWTKKYDDFGDPIYTEHTYYQCSACRRKSAIKENYCPSCGARMDEED